MARGWIHEAKKNAGWLIVLGALIVIAGILPWPPYCSVVLLIGVPMDHHSRQQSLSEHKESQDRTNDGAEEHGAPTAFRTQAERQDGARDSVEQKLRSERESTSRSADFP